VIPLYLRFVPPMSGSVRSRAVIFLLFIAICLEAAPAAAQTVSGFADNRFEPPGADSAWLNTESLGFDGHLRPVAAFATDWAWKPLVVYNAQGQSVSPLVRNQVFGHLDLALMLWDRVRADLNFPFVLVNSGDGTRIGTTSYAPPDGAALGDFRIGVDGIVYRRPDGQFTAAVGMQLFVPTGQTAAFSSDGGVRWWPRVAVAGDRGAFAWAARLGLQVRPSDGCQCNLAPGTEIDGALAGGWRPRAQWLLGPELVWSHSVASGAGALHGGTPLELMAGGHYAATPEWTFNLGVGHGLTNGAGTPAFRLIGGVQYAYRRGRFAPRSE
jgi:OOP family OmpA-OmpF porin